MQTSKSFMSLRHKQPLPPLAAEEHCLNISPDVFIVFLNDFVNDYKRGCSSGEVMNDCTGSLISKSKLFVSVINE